MKSEDKKDKEERKMPKIEKELGISRHDEGPPGTGGSSSSGGTIKEKVGARVKAAAK